MTDTNKQIDELENIFETSGIDDILHNLAWNGTYNDAGQIVISDVAIKEAKAQLHDLMVRERLSELKAIPIRRQPLGSNYHLYTHREYNDRIKSLEATLNTKENTE